jgi:hypothetical protein
MTNTPRGSLAPPVRFAVRPHGAPGLWYTDVNRYHQWARSQLLELQALHVAIAADEADWPDVDFVREDVSPQKWSTYVQRCMLSDTTVVFAAMAVEAFLNLYGVARMGEAVYSEHFERLGLIPKVRQLLLLCDGIVVDMVDPVVKHANAVAQRRNELVHPKAREPGPGGDAPERWKRPVLDAALESVVAMRSFFVVFQALVPDATAFFPRDWRHDVV